MKISLKVVVLFLLLIFTIKCWINFTSSFRLDKIQNMHLDDFNFQCNNCSNLDSILLQKFKFLSKGRQSFVFSSEDDKYVIKFFRYHRYTLPLSIKIFSSFPIINNFSNKLDGELKDFYIETMMSYKLTYEKLQRETSTIFVHLNKTSDLNKKITIVDKFNIKHIIDLDKYGFVIQKKAKSFSKELLRLKNDKNAFENLIASFFDNLNDIYKKNMMNNDRHVIDNLGVIDDRVVEIDIGRFSPNNKINQKQILENEARRYTVYLKRWLMKNNPDELAFFDSQLNKLINQNEQNSL